MESVCEDFVCLLMLFSSFRFCFGSSQELNTSFQFIKDSETLSSGDFKLGFFSPENSTNRYVGIWYLSESTIIWVANRNQPLRDSSGLFTISEDDNLVVLNAEKQTLWSSNVSNILPNSSIVQFLDTGNLVLRDMTTGTILWESFQHPSDSFLPKMKIGTNPETGQKAKLTSWKSPSDPSIGSFSASIEHPDAPEVIVYNGSNPYWRSGPWNGRVFLGLYQMGASYLRGFYLGKEEDGTSFITFDFANKSILIVFKLNSMGKWVISGWKNKKKRPSLMFQVSECDVYGQCGAFGSCNRQSSPICSCLNGFEPKNPEEWNRQNWRNGCVRKEPLKCEKRFKNGSEGDGFVKLEMMNVPDFAERSSVPEDKCRIHCLENCSCLAYAYDATIGCMTWGSDLIDVQGFPYGGIDLYIRLANSELDKEAENSDDRRGDKRRNERKNMTIIIAISATIGATIFAACSYVLWTTAKSKGKINRNGQSESLTRDSKQDKLDELPLFEFEKLAIATNNFHPANKLGRGGFGPVYKGELHDAQQIIAVKTLSRASGQGFEEFMNEVKVISKLQHRNLVRLLGCCVERDEKMLIYEYMSNKSLDVMLFDSKSATIFDWRKRYKIIEGIARGLLYLHRDLRLKIIHRDLKASNILLDEDLNPKISDFGLAKIFGGGENEANTRRIVGTYGYMAPEYAMEGLFSEKSDVFSFGVLLLEIISRKKNTSFYHKEMSLSLLGSAWKLWSEDNISSLIDPEIYDPCHHKDILTCIHIGLLCVQELAKDRPNMATVTSMLNSEILNLPSPTQPAFTKKQNIVSTESSQQSDRICSINNVTFTNIQGR